jgi:ABC-type antimicrobial peptide transport system permease subunit
MMAIGTSGQRLFATVLVEALLLGVLASAVGVGIGLAIHNKIATTGIDVAETYGSEVEVSGVVMEGRIYSYLPTETVVVWALIVVGIAVASAVYPAWRAARLQPIEAMRHV